MELELTIEEYNPSFTSAAAAAAAVICHSVALAAESVSAPAEQTVVTIPHGRATHAE